MSGTDPMTHPLTPREKVELKPCPFCGGEVFADQEKSSFIIGCFRTKCGMEPYCTGDDLNEVAKQWNRRTALASGSGDHAELARLAEAATPGPWTTCVRMGGDAIVDSPTRPVARIDYRRDEASRDAEAAFIAAANPAAVLALLAEITALRVENTEAERKLAEARSMLLRWRRHAPTEALEDLTDAWLSKEAERG